MSVSKRMILGGLTACMVIVACQSSTTNDVGAQSTSTIDGGAQSTSAAYNGPHTMECSNGPPLTAEPPYGTWSTESVLPRCVPRCGEQRQPGALAELRYAVSALPSGACAHDGELCEMAAGSVTTCPEFGSKICDLSDFECRCANGSWQCITRAQGEGNCPCQVDAGQADANLPDAG